MKVWVMTAASDSAAWSEGEIIGIYKTKKAAKKERNELADYPRGYYRKEYFYLERMEVEE